LPAITVSAPNTALNWARGSTQQIAWTHNLGQTAFVRIEISRDGGATYSDIVASVKNSSSSSGTFNWTVTGPNTTTALIRVSWTNGPASDVSNTTFTIAEPYLTLTAPAVGADWGYGSAQRPTWQSNLGSTDLLKVELSVDGGVTFPTVLY